jgi:hypothetical protein
MGTWPYVARWRSRCPLSVLLTAGLVTPLLPAAAGSLGSEVADRVATGLVEVAYNESTTDAEGHLVQNAVRVRAAGQEVVVGNRRLG